MSTLQTKQTKTRIAIVDDNSDNRDTLCSLVNQGGWVAVAIDQPAGIPGLVEHIRAHADVALTDLRLSESWAVNFNGAELAEALFLKRFPTVVVSEYAQDDAETVLRLHRRFLPAVVPADVATTFEGIHDPLEQCAKELEGHVPRGRRPWRSLIRIEGVAGRQGERLLEVVVPEWDPSRRVRFPAAMLPAHLRAAATAGKRLFAMVNTDAPSSDALFFYDFEAAPEPAH